jgi:hypothetical protein
MLFLLLTRWWLTVLKDEFVLAVLAASDGAEFTPVQVQKLFFLLDRKAPNIVEGPYFDFHPDDYGPFDSSVYSTLESLSRAGHVSIDCVQDLRRRLYRPTIAGQKIGRDKLSHFPLPVQEYIASLSRWLRGLSFADLVTYVYTEFPEMKANSIFRQR